jgi:hypothetical protein
VRSSSHICEVKEIGNCYDHATRAANILRRPQAIYSEERDGQVLDDHVSLEKEKRGQILTPSIFDLRSNWTYLADGDSDDGIGNPQG